MTRILPTSARIALAWGACLGPPCVHADAVVAMDRVSMASDGSQADGSSFTSAISADGRYVAFDSGAANLTPAGLHGPDFEPLAPTGYPVNVYVRDRRLGTTERISVGIGGGGTNGGSNTPTISADGRYVAYTSVASNIVAGDTNGYFDVFVRDRTLGTTVRASVATDGSDVAGGGYASADFYNPNWISSNGRYLVFASYKQLTANATTATLHLYRRDLVAGVTELVSVTPAGVDVNNVSAGGAISQDGRYVMFQSGASDIVPGIPSFTSTTLFVRDMQLGVTASLTPHLSTPDLCWSSSGDNRSYNLSPNGRFAVFNSYCADIALGQTVQDRLFIRDLLAGTTSVLHLAQGGTEDPQGAAYYSVAGSGSFVLAWTQSALIPTDTNNLTDIYLRDRGSARTWRISERVDGTAANGSNYAPGAGAGGHVVFASEATNLVDGDTNQRRDIFVATLDAVFSSSFQ